MCVPRGRRVRLSRGVSRRTSSRTASEPTSNRTSGCCTASISGREREADAGAAARAVLGPDRPPCASTRPRAIASPRPAPRDVRAGRRARSGRTSSRGLGGRPSPVSSTLTRTSAARGSTTTATAPSDGVCRRAFVRRFRSTRSTLSGAQRVGRRSSICVSSLICLAAASASTPRRTTRRGRRRGRVTDLERERAGVDARELEQIVDEEPSVAPARASRAGILRLGEAVLEGLDHRLHRGERRAEVVARPGD